MTSGCAVCHKHGLESSERVILAHTAKLIELEPTQLGRCNCDGPREGIQLGLTA